MKVVYIASPYSNGSQAANVAKQMEAYIYLANMGYCPIAPLLSHFLEIYHSFKFSNWLEIDKKLISISDIVLRLDGESVGADIEVEYAKNLGKKIVYSIEKI